MGKLLEISDRIVLGLAILEDLLEDVLTGGGIPGHAYKTVYRFMPRKYKKSNFYAACLRRLSTQDIERVVINGQPYLRLTGKGKKKVIRYFPLLKLREKKWDGYLRVVIFDIAEINRNLRNKFRRKLDELGFKMWQRSVWISLLPIEEDFREFLVNNELLGQVYLLKDKGESIKDIKEFIRRVWSLDKLEVKYEHFLDKYEFKDLDLGKFTVEKKQKIKSEFLEILLQDPLLPVSVLPINWIGGKVRKLVKNL